VELPNGTPEAAEVANTAAVLMLPEWVAQVVVALVEKDQSD
jgi:hypothetical protein